MSRRWVTGIVVGSVVWIAPSQRGGADGDGLRWIAEAIAQESTTAGKPAAAPPKTAWGHPDLQGIWTNFDRTPFERADPAAAPRPAGGGGAGVGPPPEFSQDWNHSRLSPVRPSVVVDPPTGRVPVRPEAEARRDHDLAHLTDSWEFSSPWERCITRGVPGGTFPSDYNNARRIVQTPDLIIIQQEMIHETRIIPLDGRPRLSGKIPQWMGDSRGRWEGDTLVVETKGFDGRGWITNNGATGRIKGIPSTAALRVVERFRRVDNNTINWQATIEDPTVYTSPWTVVMPFNLEPEYKMYEYACHEGNYGMPNTLSAGRAADAEAAKKKD
jgi:hypothetical protein